MALHGISQLGYGFNVQWAYSTDSMEKPLPADKRMLEFMAKYQFNFLRIPIDYRFWLKDINGEPSEDFLISKRHPVAWQALSLPSALFKIHALAK